MVETRLEDLVLFIRMKDLLKFFLAVSKLTTTLRTGWVWRNIPDPETIAEHSFRLAFFAWILGANSGLRVRKMIEMAIIHDICEAYTGDLTPYYGILPKNAKKRKEMLQRWIRLPQNEKASLVKNRVSLEKKALLKLIKPLDSQTRARIFSLWSDFEHGVSPEGRFVKQIDKIEAMLQAIEYFGTGPDTPVVGWWEEVEELVDHPVLAKFVKSIEASFYRKERSEFDRILDFLSQVGKLKRKPRPIWLLRKVKNPNSEANHTFMFTLMAWVFAKMKEQAQFNIEKVLKMALVSRLGFANHDKALTRYDKILKTAKTPAQKKAVLEKWIRYSIGEKRELFRASYREEKKALSKLVGGLDSQLQSEILRIWEEFKGNQTLEARFVNQIYVLEVLLRALQYWAEDKKFAIEPWWEMAFEFSDSGISLEFMAELERYFYTPSQKKRRDKKVRPATSALRTKQ
jgi:putative hydrolases of HD superfamily